MSIPLIEIVPYATRWNGEFRQIAERLRAALGDITLRIDHIGSTSVPGLDAKDIIDVQVTVRSLEPEAPIITAMESAGYVGRGMIGWDHLPPGATGPESEWSKLLFTAPPGERRTHVHVRVAGRPNQRYALLFRDYLRTHPMAAEAYARVKRELARMHPTDIMEYLAVKDPVCDIIMAGAEDWAAATGWRA